jgi:coenzyme F420-reducing hydrogenase gamma subunit
MDRSLALPNRPRIAVVSFTSCEGCQLVLLSVENAILDLLRHVEIVWFREAMDERSDRYDVAFVEGSITREEEARELTAIRARARILIAFGACAALGGVNGLRVLAPTTAAEERVYGPGASRATGPVRRVADIVPVDYTMHGCPVSEAELLRVMKGLALGSLPAEPDVSVCQECKRRGNVCVADLGEACLGPIVRGGCRAICPAFRTRCEGCRGFLPGSNLAGMVRGMRDRGHSDPEIRRLFERYHALEGAAVAAAFAAAGGASFPVEAMRDGTP